MYHDEYGWPEHARDEFGAWKYCDEDAVRRIVREEIPAPPTIRIQMPDRPEVEMARQHERFPLLLQTLAVGLNVLLVGPAGTGKTTAARKAAEALGLGFSCLSVGPQTSKSDLLGFVDAGGTYRESLFVQAYRDGGVFLLDEIDAPLDDANVYRFNDLLQHIGEKSQIVMITHNKRTMEFADTLFGITMEQKGVSKVVSVNLKRPETVAA